VRRAKRELWINILGRLAVSRPERPDAALDAAFRELKKISWVEFLVPDAIVVKQHVNFIVVLIHP
jgi:hypothetical protein